MPETIRAARHDARLVELKKICSLYTSGKRPLSLVSDDVSNQLHTLGFAKTGIAATGGAPFKALSRSRRCRARGGGASEICIFSNDGGAFPGGDHAGRRKG